MWSSAGRKLAHLRQVGWVAVVLAVTAIGVAACGDDSEGGGKTAAANAAPSADLAVGDHSILIETHVKLPTGEVLSESFIDDSDFCPGGSFRDEHGDESVGLVVRTFTCPEGRLRIGFSPTQPSLIQSSAWHVVSGSGRFDGLADVPTHVVNG
jgi:hypothetical protein